MSACFPDLPETTGGDSSDAQTDEVGSTVDSSEPPDAPDIRDVANEGDAADVGQQQPDTRPSNPPSLPELAATQDRSDGVLVTWTASPTARTYRIHKGGAVVERLASEGTAWLDVDAPEPPPYGAPARLVASTDGAASVTLTWDAPERPSGVSVEYRIEAINEAGSSGLSTAATGARTAAAIVGWEVQVDGGSWSRPGALDTIHEDVTAPPPEVSIEEPVATQGGHRAAVWLSVGAVEANAVDVSYRVRGVLGDGGTTPESNNATGARATANIVWTWVSSLSPAGPDWNPVGPATSSASLSDDTAPVDGTSRYYRIEARVEGVLLGASDVVEGWRLAFQDIAGGQYHFCGLTTRGRVWRWGENSSGQLGRGTTSPELEPVAAAPVEGLDGIAGLASGRRLNIAWYTNGDAVAWGFGTYGDGAAARTSARPITFEFPSIDSASPGVVVACLTDTSRRPFCWGSAGLVGDGTFEARAFPTRVRLSTGWNLEDVAAIARPHDHTCAVTVGGSVHCWGIAADGRTGSTAATESGYHVSAQPAVPGLDDVRGVTVSYGASCAVQGNGLVRCWGSADHGAPASGASPSQIEGLTNVTALAATFSTFCALRENGTVWCWGSNTEGGLGRDSDIQFSSSAAAVVGLSGVRALAGSAFTSQSFCAVLDDYGIACWGGNSAGQLGDGSTEQRSRPAPTQFP